MYERVLVTLDGSQFAESAIQHATRVTTPGGRIHLLSVVTEDPVSEVSALATALAQPFGMIDVQFTPDALAKHQEYVAARRDYLTQLAEMLQSKGYEVITEVRAGNPIDEIVTVAEGGMEIVIMASHGRTGFSRLALGSVAEGVLRRAPCPVLIIPIAAAAPQ
ncbi:MAG TPA: universal stress protein [Aggregatilineales bacterium]|nr:universal stress protein [Anaerolineales bacterium]HRE47488.1 universal stress protein [Aggregatilineales bacterium]